MPAITKGSLVLVTGASGFVGIHTVKAFLDAGYPVRGTVRSEEKGQYLAKMFKNSPAKFEYVIVPDMSKLEAFDDAVKGVVGVAHTASPFHFSGKDVQKDYVDPAVNGTVGVLHSIKKNAPEVQRVVITSSVAAIMDPSPSDTPRHYDETVWNEHSPREVREKGNSASPLDMYCASKTFAEEAFWKFFKDEKVSFDGATINPVMIYGPILQDVTKASQLNTSVGWIYDSFTGNHTREEMGANPAFSYIDVRDVALGHLRALEVPEAGGQRFITSDGVGTSAELLIVFDKYWPNSKGHPKPAVADKKAQEDRADKFDGSKTERVLGIKYIDQETSIKDTVQSLVDKIGLNVE